MKVRETEFVGRNKPKDIVNLSVGSGWSAPIRFPIPVRFNNVLCTHFNLSEYGAIRLSQAANEGKYLYWPEDKVLPTAIDDTEKGFMVIPWGESMKLAGCGISVEMWEDNGNVVIEYKTKSTYDSKRVYMFRVEFPIKEHNVVRVYYYHCVSGYDTYVGAVLGTDDYVSWPLKENQPYMKKALEFTCTSDSTDDVVDTPLLKPTDDPGTGYEWKLISTPFNKFWKRVKIQDVGVWTILYENSTVKLSTKI